MGRVGATMLVQFPKRHVLASAGSAAKRKPKRDGSGVLPFLASASEKIKNTSDGNLPRAFQLLTAESPTPAMPAVEVGPPSASITASTELSIPANYSHSVNMSSLHNAEIFTGSELRPNGAMSRTLQDIAKRLEMTRKALGISAAQIARDTDISANEWSQYINPDKYKRRISNEHVFELKDAYGATLEWIFDGDVSSLKGELAAKVRKLIKSAA